MLFLLNCINMALTLILFLKISFRYAARTTYSNVTDSTNFTMTSYYEFRVTGFATFLVLDRVGIELSSLVTCCLTCTRAITVWAPFYRIREPLVYVALGIYLLGMIPRETYYVYNDTYLKYMLEDSTNNINFKFARYGFLAIMWFVVIVASGMVVVKLSLNKRMQLNESSTRNASKATHTILILSGSFLFWNAFYVIVQLYPAVWGLEGTTLKAFTSTEIYRFGLWIAVPMDALCSPIIYFIRIKQMRGLFLGLMMQRPYDIESSVAHVITNENKRPRTASNLTEYNGETDRKESTAKIVSFVIESKDSVIESTRRSFNEKLTIDVLLNQNTSC